jgi:hypothetical protein
MSKLNNKLETKPDTTTGNKTGNKKSLDVFQDHNGLRKMSYAPIFLLSGLLVELKR